MAQNWVCSLRKGTRGVRAERGGSAPRQMAGNRWERCYERDPHPETPAEMGDRPAANPLCFRLGASPSQTVWTT